MIKMGFFDKIDNSTVVNNLKQLLKRRDHEIFSQISCKLEHSTRMCFTISGKPQDPHVAGPSPDSKYECVKRQWPLCSLLITIESTITTITVSWHFVQYQKKHTPTHPSWSSSNLCRLLPSTMIHSIFPVEFMCLSHGRKFLLCVTMPMVG